MPFEIVTFRKINSLNNIYTLRYDEKTGKDRHKGIINIVLFKFFCKILNFFKIL